MAFRVVSSHGLILLIVFSLMLTEYGAAATKSKYEEEEKEDLELERQLKTLNKPPIKTIKTAYGDIFDCVDIYKQPAFDNPLLKDHKIQMKPTSSVTKMKNEASLHGEPSLLKYSKIGLEKGCPPGTVPIRRTQKEELKWAKSFQKSHHANFRPDYQEKVFYNDIGAFSGVYANIDKNKKYHGGGGLIAIYNPTVSFYQFSGAYVSVQSFTPRRNNYIRVGWTVSPQLYGDNNTRLFTLWTSDTYGDCFNILCPAFVQVNSAIPLGAIYANTSFYGGTQYAARYIISQDKTTRNWWLLLEAEHIKIGYWPTSLFTRLDQGADTVLWHGNVYGSPGEPGAPMGSGYYPKQGYGWACFFADLEVVNESYTLVQADGSMTIKNDQFPCYGVGNVEKKGSPYFNTFLFGGPGGKTLEEKPSGHCIYEK